MSKLIDITSYPVRDLLKYLLKDKTTGQNIIWATDTYADYGEGFQDRQQITRAVLLSHPDIIKPRIAKSQEDQQTRTRKKAEVFTPVWLCNQMNNYCDEEWFGRKNVFNVENSDHTWDVVQDKIEHPDNKPWQKYVDSRRLEITCGEAPFLVSRYDAATGSLLIARLNLLMTFVDYYRERWRKDPDTKLLGTVAVKISWNIWQMDGLKDTVPLGKPQETYHQMSLFEMDILDSDTKENDVAPFCKIQDWRDKSPVIFHSLKRGN